MAKTYPRLNIGAGRAPKKEGVINADIHPGPGVDVIFDACQKWPFDDSSIGLIESHHVLEHLRDPWTFFREAHRVLVPAEFCNLQIRLPHGSGTEAFMDPTHLRAWAPGSFCAFQPGYNEAIFNPQYDSWDAPFNVMYVYVRVNPRLRWLMKPGIKKWGVKALDFIWNGCIELVVGMQPLKSKEQVEQWKKKGGVANRVPLAFCMYEHEYRGRPLKEGETQAMRFFN